MPKKKKVQFDEDGYPDTNILEREVKDGKRFESRQHQEQKVRSITINPPEYMHNQQVSDRERLPPRKGQSLNKPKPGVRQVWPKPNGAKTEIQVEYEDRSGIEHGGDLTVETATGALQVSDEHLQNAIAKDLSRRGVKNIPTDY